MTLMEKIAARKRGEGYNFICNLCAREVFAGERICAPCRQTLAWNNGKICPLCGRKVGEAGVCLACKQSPPKADKVRSVCLHEGAAMRLVLRFKSGGKHLAAALAELSLPLVKREFEGAEYLIPVPMTARAQKERGYNQALLFAQSLSDRCGIPVLQAAEKRKETEAQKRLGRAEREKNLAGCFRVTEHKKIKGKTVLIVDDALTTGATVNELAATLKRAGCGSVYALTFTSVQNKTPFGVPPKGE